jgi:hypothetical protein
MAVLLYLSDIGNFVNHTLATQVMPALKSVIVLYRFAPL